MANQEHLDLLWKGVEAWNQWRIEHADIKPDLSYVSFAALSLSYPEVVDKLSNCDLGEAKLVIADVVEAIREANFSKADLDRTKLGGHKHNWANFSGVNFSAADLSFASFRGADFSEANLSGAILMATDLYKANLRGTTLLGATFLGTNLFRVDLSQANVGLTTFAEVDLSTVKGLDTVIHHGPSEISISTLYRSQGTIPEIFLRGIGIPDTFITYIHSLVTSPLDYSSCFICYSSHDQSFAERLYTELQSKGVRCWFALHDIRTGDKIRQRIDEAIHLQDKLLLLLSEHALASARVEDEVEAALEKEQRQQRQVLFPVRLDESVMHTTQSWAAKLRRTRHIGDFTRWTDPQEYQKAFERLLRDLKTSP